VGELVGDALRPAAPEGLIGQRDRQLALRVGHHARASGLRVLVGRLLRARLAQRLRPLDGPVGGSRACSLRVYSRVFAGDSRRAWHERGASVVWPPSL
jgi:hypothetical protein